MYSITVEPECQLMRIAVSGFWPSEILPGYIAELHRQTEGLKPFGGCRRILVDMSDYPIQSQEVAQAHARIIAYGKDALRAATAVVMTSPLSKLQAKRMANLAGHELFDEEAGARAWLLAQPDL
ncbi:hypothetical protein ACFSC3_15805 [Sphingomonas floccifaciens]|uniref:STAS/SEC14 domain-containing protein n=1 Tax=Sphingomonas floccifaciens TaxID=1844115 RepID=A0ABW4NGK2_9SPHN